MILLRLSGGDDDDGDNEDAVNEAEQLPSHDFLPSQVAANGSKGSDMMCSNKIPPKFRRIKTL